MRHHLGAAPAARVEGGAVAPLAALVVHRFGRDDDEAVQQRGEEGQRADRQLLHTLDALRDGDPVDPHVDGVWCHALLLADGEDRAAHGAELLGVGVGRLVAEPLVREEDGQMLRQEGVAHRVDEDHRARVAQLLVRAELAEPHEFRGAHQHHRSLQLVDVVHRVGHLPPHKRVGGKLELRLAPHSPPDRAAAEHEQYEHEQAGDRTQCGHEDPHVILGAAALIVLVERGVEVVAQHRGREGQQVERRAPPLHLPRRAPVVAGHIVVVAPQLADQRVARGGERGLVDLGCGEEGGREQELVQQPLVEPLVVVAEAEQEQILRRVAAVVEELGEQLDEVVRSLLRPALLDQLGYRRRSIRYLRLAVEAGQRHLGGGQFREPREEVEEGLLLAFGRRGAQRVRLSPLGEEGGSVDQLARPAVADGLGAEVGRALDQPSRRGVEHLLRAREEGAAAPVVPVPRVLPRQGPRRVLATRGVDVVLGRHRRVLARQHLCQRARHRDDARAPAGRPGGLAVALLVAGARKQGVAA
mmetsp:Transcript_12392/g.39488  ORF Transcript_12392/g.39488 Transcript_12392/m.39488 type:complete len:528 (-) Transcript_12392:966-2549(-)